MREPIKRHTFSFNPRDYSAEGLTLTTKYFDNGDRAKGLPVGIFTNQELTLQSYGNCTTIHLCGIAMLINSMHVCEKF